MRKRYEGITRGKEPAEMSRQGLCHSLVKQFIHHYDWSKLYHVSLIQGAMLLREGQVLRNVVTVNHHIDDAYWASDL